MWQSDCAHDADACLHPSTRVVPCMHHTPGIKGPQVLPCRMLPFSVPDTQCPSTSPSRPSTCFRHLWTAAPCDIWLPKTATVARKKMFARCRGCSLAEHADLSHQWPILFPISHQTRISVKVSCVCVSLSPPLSVLHLDTQGHQAIFSLDHAAI